MKVASLLIVIAVFLTGCATQPQNVWTKQGASAQDFDIDSAQCNAQAFAGGYGNLWTIAIIQNQCLRGKGWYGTDPKNASTSNNELLAERDEIRRKSRERCADPKFAVIYEKTPCLSGSIDFKYMTDETRITSAQKNVFIEWRLDLGQSVEKIVEFETRLNGGVGRKVAANFLSAKIEDDKNNLDLYNGKITWGQYNSRRKEISSRFSNQ